MERIIAYIKKEIKDFQKAKERYAEIQELFEKEGTKNNVATSMISHCAEKILLYEKVIKTLENVPKHNLNISDDAQLLKLASEAFTDGKFTCPECESTVFEHISDTHVECERCGYVMSKNTNNGNTN